MFYCASQIIASYLFIFLQIEGLRQPCVKQVYGAIFPTAFTHFMSLSHIHITILMIFHPFSLLLRLSWRSVISDL